MIFDMVCVFGCGYVCDDLVDDVLWIFVVWVVVCDDDFVGELFCDCVY